MDKEWINEWINEWIKKIYNNIDDLDGIALSEKSQTEKYKYCMISLIDRI